MGPAADAALSNRAVLPALQTARLILRAPSAEDFSLWLRIANEPGGEYIGGPVEEKHAWYDFCGHVACWLLHGHGPFVLIRRDDETALGFVFVGYEWDDTEPELGWFLAQEHRRQGYGTEAAMAVRDWALGLLPSFVSCVRPSNVPSTRLAKRLGAVHDEIASKAVGTGMWRHGGEPEMRPELETSRLRMVPPNYAHLTHYLAFYAIPNDQKGGYRAPRPVTEVRDLLLRDLSGWQRNGFGMFLLFRRDTCAFVGGTGLAHPVDWPRHELTWWLMPEARGHGFAAEASRAVIDWAYDTLDWPVVETHMRDTNVPARRLAERLGGTVITRETFPDGVARDVFALPRQMQDIS
ncbi:MAG: GNAT family N-acetyltransferase [Pseudomonadota bacterium]